MTFFAFIVVCIIGGPCPIHLVDEYGPYTTKEECFERGGMMIRDLSHRVLLATSQVFCSEKDPDPDKDPTKDETGV